MRGNRVMDQSKTFVLLMGFVQPIIGPLMTQLLQKDEWVIYSAFLPALFTLAGIGASAAMAWHAQKPWHIPAISKVCAGADDYVEGLAKRGIVKPLGYEFPPFEELSTPAAAVAAAKLRARYMC